MWPMRRIERRSSRGSGRSLGPPGPPSTCGVMRDVLVIRCVFINLVGGTRCVHLLLSGRPRLSHGHTLRRPETRVDPLSRTVRITYDPAGRMVHTTYDASGDFAAITPPTRPAHTFEYTPIDLEAAYTPPRSGRRECGHDVLLQSGPAAHADSPPQRPDAHPGLRAHRWPPQHADGGPGPDLSSALS